MLSYSTFTHRYLRNFALLQVKLTRWPEQSLVPESAGGDDNDSRPVAQEQGVATVQMAGTAASPPTSVTCMVAISEMEGLIGGPGNATFDTRENCDALCFSMR